MRKHVPQTANSQQRCLGHVAANTFVGAQQSGLLVALHDTFVSLKIKGWWEAKVSLSLA